MSTAASVGIAGSASPVRSAPGATPALASGVVGMWLFLFTEAMFFAGLVSAFVVLRLQAASWPPPDQPRLPVAVTGANTVVLLLSGIAMIRARAMSAGADASRWIARAFFLGCVFLAVQGFEWARLLGYGLTTRSGMYGATFYAIVGIHATHVVAALIALFVVWRRVVRVPGALGQPLSVTLAAMFWLFVVGVWPILYLLLYEPWR